MLLRARYGKWCTLNRVFCHIQSFVYLQFYSIGKIVNIQRIVCDRIPGSRYSLMLTCISFYVNMYLFSLFLKSNLIVIIVYIIIYH